MKIEFLNLGKQPLANNFVTKEEFGTEFTYDLKVTFDDETKLVSLENFVKPELMFNDHYAYSSSGSKTMRDHFRNIAEHIKSSLPVFYNVLEIGSNDGVFMKHFSPTRIVGVEPCSNFAQKTRDIGYSTYDEFWSTDLAEKLTKKHGKFSVIYSANCMCHIQNIQEAFDAVALSLSDTGAFIFEDPSMLDVIKNISFDQFYDEHAHVFSILALKNLLEKSGLYIYKIEHLNTHGGSNRIYCSKLKEREQVEYNIDLELGYGLDKIETYKDFAKIVDFNRELLYQFIKIDSKNKKIIGYGATSKSNTIYNYCKIDNSMIEYIIDTTPEKQGRYTPITHIPIIAHPEKIDADYVFLGAWNYQDEIFSKEHDRKFEFITHVPCVRYW